jgi:hypothetical protein
MLGTRDKPARRKFSLRACRLRCRSRGAGRPVRRASGRRESARPRHWCGRDRRLHQRSEQRNSPSIATCVTFGAVHRSISVSTRLRSPSRPGGSMNSAITLTSERVRAERRCRPLRRGPRHPARYRPHRAITGRSPSQARVSAQFEDRCPPKESAGLLTALLHLVNRVEFRAGDDCKSAISRAGSPDPRRALDRCSD